MNLFVAGTDTGVGKTVVATILALKMGWRYWKPIQSGTQEATDSEFCAQFIGAKQIWREAYRLAQPLSPHLSAQHEKISISVDYLLDHAQSMESTIIEGAGGLLAPINQNNLFIDVIPALQAPVILVARSTLGTINHSLLSLSALRLRQIEPLGVVMVGVKNASNAQAIEHYGKTRILGELPLFRDLNHDTLVHAGRLIHLPDSFVSKSRPQPVLKSQPNRDLQYEP